MYIIDDEDITKWEPYTWYVDNNGYVRAEYGGRKNKKSVYLHRVITDAKKGQVVDHINGDKLDNRKCNLRMCTQKQNSRNSRIVKVKTSKYKGVHYDKSRKKWAAKIKVDYKDKFLGRFDNEIDAAKEYNNAAKKYFGQYAVLNQI